MVDQDRIPGRARAKIFALADQEASAQTVMNSNQRQIAELMKSFDISSDDQRKMELREEAERRNLVQVTHRERHHALADLNGRVRRFLDMLPIDAVLEPVKVIRASLKRNETYQEAVADLRVQIVKLIGERSQVERAGLPTDEIKAQVKKWITERSIAARPAIIATHDKFDVKFTFMDPESYTPTLDPLSLLAWYDPEFLEGRLNELVDEMPKPKFSMTPALKFKRLREIRTELDDVERREVTLIDNAQDQGILIDHRPNVDICALLAVTMTRKAKANAA
jgi:hypothetical protein